ncbi:hypothetical protein [Pseudomonas orientalis]|uniref:hypothetical protein n=1 Tax=Pseudomonas orientalis TaxID=76758 RepID=UPI0012FFFE08|nr:hypothetical protein [Pseudomonas orientalis]
MITDYTSQQRKNLSTNEAIIKTSPSSIVTTPIEILELKAARAFGSLSTFDEITLRHKLTDRFNEICVFREGTEEHLELYFRDLERAKEFSFAFNAATNTVEQFMHGVKVYNNLTNTIPRKAEKNITAYPFESFEHYLARMQKLIPCHLSEGGFREIIRKHWYVSQDLFSKQEDGSVLYGPTAAESFLAFHKRASTFTDRVDSAREKGYSNHHTNTLLKYLGKHEIKFKEPVVYIKPWIDEGGALLESLEEIPVEEKKSNNKYSHSNSSLSEKEQQEWADMDDFVIHEWDRQEAESLEEWVFPIPVAVPLPCEPLPKPLESVTDVIEDVAQSNASNHISAPVDDLQDLNWSFVAGVVVGAAATGLLISKLFSK